MRERERERQRESNCSIRTNLQNVISQHFNDASDDDGDGDVEQLQNLLHFVQYYVTFSHRDLKGGRALARQGGLYDVFPHVKRGFASSRRLPRQSFPSIGLEMSDDQQK